MRAGIVGIDARCPIYDTAYVRRARMRENRPMSGYENGKRCYIKIKLQYRQGETILLTNFGTMMASSKSCEVKKIRVVFSRILPDPCARAALLKAGRSPSRRFLESACTWVG